ncbi:major pollen allergen Ole e 10-like [Hibiscus syriacus]|uniref:major pollen allergen Ole e 10-like n=1 Tax=Hibiscus syriacus TaxID=106335 RepID=UPI00192290AB|nr:major pollen allergen Ole e 10-like [Hibiscus syriacus]
MITFYEKDGGKILLVLEEGDLIEAGQWTGKRNQRLTEIIPYFSIETFSLSNSHVFNDKGGKWYVAKPSTDDAALASNINYACDYIGSKGLNCSQIQQEGACFVPDTLINHASYAMNAYYQAYGRQPHQSYFTNSALITISNPSKQLGNCQYA